MDGSSSRPERSEGDHRLAQRCVSGDRAAQRELFHAHRRRVHATFYRIFGSNAGIDDLIQDAFMNVFRSLATYRGEASLATWIDRCVVRVAYLHIAQRKLRPPALELVSDMASPAPSAEQRVVAREAARRLYEYLDRMPPKLRIAFTLFAVDGRSLAEIAALTSSSVVAAKARVWRARRWLAQHARNDPALAPFVDAERVEAEDVA